MLESIIKLEKEKTKTAKIKEGLMGSACFV